MILASPVTRERSLPWAYKQPVDVGPLQILKSTMIRRFIGPPHNRTNTGALEIAEGSIRDTKNEVIPYTHSKKHYMHASTRARKTRKRNLRTKHPFPKHISKNCRNIAKLILKKWSRGRDGCSENKLLWAHLPLSLRFGAAARTHPRTHTYRCVEVQSFHYTLPKLAPLYLSVQRHVSYNQKAKSGTLSIHMRAGSAQESLHSFPTKLRTRPTAGTSHRSVDRCACRTPRS